MWDSNSRPFGPVPKLAPYTARPIDHCRLLTALISKQSAQIQISVRSNIHTTCPPLSPHIRNNSLCRQICLLRWHKLGE